MGVGKSAPKSSLEESVFLNDYILHNIFEYLEPKHLLQCRLVHPLWLKEATKIPQKRNSFTEIKISFTENQRTQAKLFSPSEEHKTKPKPLKSAKLKNFQKLLQKSTTFPVTAFHLETANFDNEKMREFCHNFGWILRNLTLTIEGQSYCNLTQENLSNFQNIVTSQLPNVESLHVEKCPNFNLFKNIEMGGSSQLNSLKVLSLHNYFNQTDLFDWVLNQAPNLTQVRNSEGRFETSILNQLILREKAHLLKDIRFEFSRCVDILEVLQNMSTQNPKLEEIHDFFFPESMPCPNKENLFFEIAEVVNLFLNSGAQTLKKLTISNSLRFCQLLSFPLLLNLRELNLKYSKSQYEVSPKFSIAELTEKFPKLTVVNLNLSAEVFDSEPQNILGVNTCNSFSSVKDLRFSTDILLCLMSSSWHLYLRELFPNVEKLRLPKLMGSNFSKSLGEFWRNSFSDLKELQLTIFVDAGNISEEVDSAFTGFSKETCADFCDPMWGGRLRFIGCSNMDELRINPSILDLKSLRKLDVEFITTGCRPPICEVSRRFAFQLCPQLEVRLTSKKQDC